MTLFWFEVCIDNIKINIKDHTGKYKTYRASEYRYSINCKNNIYSIMLILRNQIYFFFALYLRSKKPISTFLPDFTKA